MQCEVSVVVPTRDRPTLLLRALESVERAVLGSRLRTRAESVESIVVDDGHSDEVRRVVTALCQRLSHRVRYARNSLGAGLGPASARNYGVALSEGPFVYFLDDDDEFLPSRFDRSLELLRSGRGDTVLECGLRQAGDGKWYIAGPKAEMEVDAFEYLLTGGIDTHIAMAATSFTRQAFERVGGLDERLRWGEDGEFLMRLALEVRVRLLGGDPVALKHRHPGNLSRADQLKLWHSMRMLRTLYEKVDTGRHREERKSLRSAISGKLDFALSECRARFGYGRRLKEGLAVMAEVPMGCVRWRNVKSVVVWLLKPQDRTINRW